MSVLELKNNLHRMVVETDDETILNQIKLLFEVLRDEPNAWGAISEDEKQKIQQGLADLRTGKVKTHEEVRARVNTLLNRA
jgi:methionine synthase II (cobalamin-independent)